MGLSYRILVGDVRERLKELAAGSVQTCVTSPPYFGLRDYGVTGQIGMEASPAEYISTLVAVFEEVWRVLADDGTLWLNLGDSYAGSWGAQSRQGATGQMASRSVVSARQIAVAQRKASHTGSVVHLDGIKAKDLMMIPARVALALQADGWYLRSDIIWSKPNPMPESVTDRPTRAHEYIFLLSKSARYFYDAGAIAEGLSESTYQRFGGVPVRTDGFGLDTVARSTGTGRTRSCGAGDDGLRNKRSVWHVATQPYPEAHFATYPEALIEPCILAGCPVGGTVLDPFTGSGTTGAVAIRHQRNFVGVELNPAYVELARTRIGRVAPLFSQELTA